MAIPRVERPLKPTVFLSHCSINRRPLLALKRLLDERTGGLIEFFLSSDDDSIAHGTIWPAEVRAGLDRMSLMLIFVSAEALKSGWTYFEAGYGLHKLGTANIYCLPGSDKANLPPPFNIIQNRNLHSTRDLSLLIQQINEGLGSKLSDTVTKQEFDGIFKKPTLGQIVTGPSFEDVVESITVKTSGPPESTDLFSQVCQERGLTSGELSADYINAKVYRYSTGVQLAVSVPHMGEMKREFKITDPIRAKGETEVQKNFLGEWEIADQLSWRQDIRSLEEIEDYNAKVRIENENIKSRNAVRSLEPRECVFTISPINTEIPIEIVDFWQRKINGTQAVFVSLAFVSEVEIVTKVVTISAKIHGSPLSMRNDGTLLWSDVVIVRLRRNEYGYEKGNLINLNSLDDTAVILSAFRIQELVSTLFDLGILVLPSQRTKRKR